MNNFAFAFFVLFVIWIVTLVDRHLWSKEIEADLKNYLSDVERAASKAEFPLKVYFEAQVFALKALIRKHFKL